MIPDVQPARLQSAIALFRWTGIGGLHCKHLARQIARALNKTSPDHLLRSVVIDEIVIDRRHRRIAEIVGAKPDLGRRHRGYDRIGRAHHGTPARSLARANIVPLKARTECRRIGLIGRLRQQDLRCRCIWRAALCERGGGGRASHRGEHKQDAETRRVVYGAVHGTVHDTLRTRRSICYISYHGRKPRYFQPIFRRQPFGLTLGQAARGGGGWAHTARPAAGLDVRPLTSRRGAQRFQVSGPQAPLGSPDYPKYSVALAARPLRGPHAAPISAAIEFRPNDLALPRSTRLTDDLPKISRQSGPRSARLSSTPMKDQST